MSDQNKESFRVVDKRRVSETGQTTSQSAGSGKADTDRAKQPDEAITYSSFIFSLGMQGLVMMGEGGMPGAAEGQTEVNLAAARETIDLLSLLKEKTRGNLSPEEEKLTDEILASLRMTYVKKTK